MWSLCMHRIMWPKSRGSETTTYLEYLTPICLFTIQLLWSYDDEYFALWSAHCKRFSVENFLSPFFRPKSSFGGPKQGNVTFNFWNFKKAHPCVISRLSSHHASKSVKGSDLRVVPRKKVYVFKNNLTLYFIHLPRSPLWTDLHLNWHSASPRG